MPIDPLSRPVASQPHELGQVEEPLFVADWRHFVRVFSTHCSAGLGQSPFNTGTLRSGGSRRDWIQVRLQTHEEDTGYPLPQGRTNTPQFAHIAAVAKLFEM